MSSGDAADEARVAALGEWLEEVWRPGSAWLVRRLSSEDLGDCDEAPGLWLPARLSGVLGGRAAPWRVGLDSHGAALEAVIGAPLDGRDGRNNRDLPRGWSAPAARRLTWRLGAPGVFPDPDLTGAAIALSFGPAPGLARAWVCESEAEAEVLAAWGRVPEPGLTLFGVVGAWSEAGLAG